MIGVLASFRPPYVSAIKCGLKRLEIRKTEPKIKAPFKVFMYETKANVLTMTRFGGKDKVWQTEETSWQKIGGVVVGEFICDKIYRYESEFCEDRESLEGIARLMLDEDGELYSIHETTNEQFDPDDCFLCRESNLSFEEIRGYVGLGVKRFYAWHISELKMYKKPIPVTRFSTAPYQHGKRVMSSYKIKRPPQSWQYVEVL